jgi:glycosyltransferase involved in cell wall biosynthesis
MIDYTIIIPHYNIPRLLRRLLRTIPQREDLQVIVVDDCSPKEALDEMAVLQTEFQNVEWYSTGTNGGGGKARNIGLQHAKGKYLIFADADDFFNLCFEETLDAYKDTSYDEVLFVTNSVDTET